LKTLQKGLEPMNLKCGRVGLSVCLLLIAGDVHGLSGKLNYRFDGKISRNVLENYLSRSITTMELDRSPGTLDDEIRMLQNIGAKFAGRTIYLWGGETRIADPKFLAWGRELAERPGRGVAGRGIRDRDRERGPSPRSRLGIPGVRATAANPELRLLENAVSGQEVRGPLGAGIVGARHLPGRDQDVVFLPGRVLYEYRNRSYSLRADRPYR
jgi:hypothetical protein